MRPEASLPEEYGFASISSREYEIFRLPASHSIRMVSLK